jgi:hypothetical protein
MEKEALLLDKSLIHDNQYRWVSKIFFNVTDAPEEKINPFSDLTQFLNARVGDLRWGKDTNGVKAQFTKKLNYIFSLYEYEIPVEEISKGLQNEGQRIKDLVKHLCSIGHFPKK